MGVCRHTYSPVGLLMSHDDHTVQLIISSEPWQPKRRQNIITVLTTLPQGWVLTCKNQCTTAITSYDVDRIFVGLSWELSYQIVCSSDGRQWGDKRAHNSTTKVSFCTIIIHLCNCMIVIARVYSQNVCGPFLQAVKLFTIRLINYITLRDTIFPLPEVYHYAHNFSPTRSVIISHSALSKAFSQLGGDLSHNVAVHYLEFRW